MQVDRWKAQAFVRDKIEGCLSAARHPESPPDLLAACAEYRKQIAQVSYQYTSGQKAPHFGDVIADVSRIVYSTRVRAITIYWHGENCLFPLIECVSRYHQQSFVDGILLPIDEHISKHGDDQ